MYVGGSVRSLCISIASLGTYARSHIHFVWEMDESAAYEACTLRYLPTCT